MLNSLGFTTRQKSADAKPGVQLRVSSYSCFATTIVLLRLSHGTLGINRQDILGVRKPSSSAGTPDNGLKPAARRDPPEHQNVLSKLRTSLPRL